MRVKNHMAIWFLWFLWFLRVSSSVNPLYKPLCAFLVFVDLLWFLCGSACGFWSLVVFGYGLRVRSCSCGLCGSVVLPRCRSRRLRVLLLFVVFVGRWSCPRCQCRRLRVLLLFVVFAVRWSCLDADADADDCASSCSLWTAKKICPSSHFVLCSVSSPLEATFTNGENDHG